MIFERPTEKNKWLSGGRRTRNEKIKRDSRRNIYLEKDWAWACGAATSGAAPPALAPHRAIVVV